MTVVYTFVESLKDKGRVYISGELNNYKVVMYCVNDSFKEALYEGFFEDVKDGDPEEHIELNFSQCSRRHDMIIDEFANQLNSVRPFYTIIKGR